MDLSQSGNWNMRYIDHILMLELGRSYNKFINESVINERIRSHHNPKKNLDITMIPSTKPTALRMCVRCTLIQNYMIVTKMC